MDKGKLKKLNSYHVVFLAQNTMIGIGLFTLPNDIGNVGYNQWMVPLILGVLANLSLIPIILICKKFPDDSIYMINKKVLGKILGQGANAILTIYGIIGASTVCRAYARLIQSIVLPAYSTLAVAIALYFVMVCVVLGGIKSVARFCILSFFTTGWMIFFLQWPLQAGNWLHVYPTFEVGVKDWLFALYNGSIAMFGYGLIMFYFPYIKNQKKAFLHTSIGIWIAVAYYFLVSLASVVYFSPWQIVNLLFPVLNLFQAIQLPFVERIENFGTTLWVFLILSTSSTYLWVAKKGVDVLINKNKNRTWHLYVVAFISWFLFTGPIPHNIQVLFLEDWTVFYGYTLLVFPILLLFVHKIRTMLEKKKIKEKEVAS
ncbi:GerAB/ArcD/ProY family transporter [Halalkalibacter alkalisediminis]|uniref:GerAB/ArcD/ProY family transporter n=1 Tax=Halalkalibacter alkalisediminis TaxID=935616 RepID=A0ABV6NG33_9BACI|nr:GerAB/ArcD/ProY family transporter [Halalkalibacter alkalisediminis]